MINFCSNALSNFSDWTEELSDPLESPWKYYTQERAVLKGLPIAMISTIAAAYLFNCAKASTGAIFGVVNYVILTFLIEIIRAHQEIDKTKACVILGISCAVSFAFVQTVCKTSMTYQTAIILGIAAFAGQLSREFLMNEDD